MIKTTKETELFSTALHEAGHILVASAVGVTVYKAVLRRDVQEDSAGFVVLQIKQEPTVAEIEFDLAITLAGGLAQILHARGKRRWVMGIEKKSKGPWLGGRDRKKAIELLVSLYYGEPVCRGIDSEEKLRFMTKELLRRKFLVIKFLKSPETQAQIYTIAQVLMKKKRQNRAQIVPLMRGLKVKNSQLFRAKMAHLSDL